MLDGKLPGSQPGLWASLRPAGHNGNESPRSQGRRAPVRSPLGSRCRRLAEGRQRWALFPVSILFSAKEVSVHFIPLSIKLTDGIDYA